MPGPARSELATESNVRTPHSAPREEGEGGTTRVVDQPICDRERGEGPHSAPQQGSAFGDGAWRLVEHALDRFEMWDVRRPTRRELMAYARKGPYTLPTVVAPDAKDNPVVHKTRTRKLGIAYHWLISTNLHSLLYAALWLVRQPSRALAKTKRPSLEEILQAARASSGPAQWVNVGILAISTAAYAALWTIERPSRLVAVSGASALFRFALIAAGL